MWIVKGFMSRWLMRASARVSASPKGMVETLECRWMLSFSNWSAIGPAIAVVPESAGAIASTSVVNFGTTIYTGPLNVTNTLDRIRANNGPDRTDDGIVFTNPVGSGLPAGHGTWYEFTVEPAGGTNINFSGSIAFPGPMRIELATDGDTYFTGDHYSTFNLVFDPASTATPTIGSFAVSPTSVVTGANVTLTATNVAETGGTISSVKFYRETNGTSGFQTTDTLVGSGTQSGTTWSLTTATAGLAAGSYTYYAVATDTASVSSAASSAALTVTNTAAPTIGSFAVNPTSVVTGANVTLTASNVTETGGTISGVKFYRESNGTSGFQTTDTLIGSGTQSGTTWSLTAATTGLSAGSYTYYAVATDTASVSSVASSTSLTVTGAVTSGELLGWNVTGQTNFGTQGLGATSVATGLSNSLGLTRASGLVTSGSATSNAWGAANWNTTSAGGISGSQYVTFGLTVASGYSATLSAVDMNYRRSGSGAVSGYWQYQINGGGWSLIGDFASQFSSSSGSGAAITELNLSGISALSGLTAGTAVNFRLVPYASTGSGGTWYVYDLTGDDLVVKGSVRAQATLPAWLAAGSAATWNASTHALSLTGTATIISDPGTDAPVITASGAGERLNINPFSDKKIHLGGLSLSGGALADVLAQGSPGPQTAHVVVIVPGSSLSIDTSSKLDVEDNDMIVTSTTPAAATSALMLVNGLAASGQNGTTLFTGNGITSSTAAADAAGLLRYAVGVVQNNISGNTLYDTFDGVGVGLNDVLVKFTYFGDADLSGEIDDTDFYLTNQGFGSGATGWVNGDFDYSGTVDDTDFFLLNDAFSNQTSVLRAGVNGGDGNTSTGWSADSVWSAIGTADRAQRILLQVIA